MVALSISLIEVFRDEIGQRISGEYISLVFDDDPALCQFTQHDAFEEGHHDCVVVRIRVKNTGNRASRGVRVLLTGVRISDGGEWKPDTGFCPIHLTWIHTDPGYLLPILPAKSDYLLNIGILIPPGTTPTDANRAYEPERFPAECAMLQLFTQKYPANNSSFLNPGLYQFDYQVLTERGVRGEGFVEFEVPANPDFLRQPSDLMKLTAGRRRGRYGQRLFQSIRSTY